ncbi:helix-turn-helix domain-containing protein [Rhodoplanes sp. TEM]|uniref:Helix-turn-helix domain-containing protein n=1 Tax=Rhodoplanes tepidamans TaxID=200616 RepID=A0ABT5JC36_RHOTP|nr:MULTISPECIES: helix-turn-helix domain-containing protein [Rhodoplanes]MDC7787246.1 helix-turn-helix domain-containing protein [Rhodoplanes tepidamans]MDC7986591.1 helix-turn-helix domain-containing protein [Rhodoplanes sp. TEM]MDQ0357781.1 DNA-binding HxlR family transcriptional regulator [Rhodoplanes tepidamans]
MTRTHEKVSAPAGEGHARHTRESAAAGVEQALKLLDGRWKLVILFHLFGGRVLRFSDLERAIPAVSQKMLAQQLRQMERDGIVRRTVHQQVPPKVEYGLTAWGQALCPALDALLTWAALRDNPTAAAAESVGASPVRTSAVADAEPP